MCFRPPAAGKPIKCPKCGAMNPPVAKQCAKCHEDLTSDSNTQQQAQEK